MKRSLSLANERLVCVGREAIADLSCAPCCMATAWMDWNSCLLAVRVQQLPNASSAACNRSSLCSAWPHRWCARGNTGSMASAARASTSASVGAPSSKWQAARLHNSSGVACSSIPSVYSSSAARYCFDRKNSLPRSRCVIGSGMLWVLETKKKRREDFVCFLKDGL